MRNLKDHLQQLLHKSEWTNEERQWLLKYLQETDGDDLKNLMQAAFEKDSSTGVQNGDVPDEVLMRIHERLGVHKKPVRVVIGKWKVIRGLAAAAAVIGLLILGTYFLPKQKKPAASLPTAQKSEPVKNDVDPGGDKAILTLADGSTIILDNEQNGELVQQGNTKVIKLGGRLTYASSDSGNVSVLYNTITTPRGGQYQIILEDGSAVWLNAASSLRFPTVFAGQERRVEINGEAYFEVAKNKKMPFVVSVNGAEVQVLGTHFNVMAYEDEQSLRTTLLEGAVKFVKGSNSVTLKPGQQSQLIENGDIRVQSSINVEKVVSWKNGYFHFDGEDIDAVSKQLARWYDVEVTVSKLIEDRFFAEIPRDTKLLEALRALELTGKVHFKLEGRKLVVKP
jgi:ferric-dicitrate binding protein FerR (iron transport regulator)